MRSINKGCKNPRPTNAVLGLKQTGFVRGSKSPVEVFAESDEVGDASPLAADFAPDFQMMH